MYRIKSLGNLPFDVLFDTFNEAFRDYEVQVTKDELQQMLKRRGFDAERSFGAFADDRLISFTFNGTGSYNGIKTAYDTGTGTIKEYRGKGIATDIFNYSVPILKEAGIERYLLEVLQHNTPAVSVYEKLGFKVSRELNYFKQDNQNLVLKQKCLPSGMCIREISLKEQAQMMTFRDFIPSWQNSFEAIERSIHDFTILGAFHAETLIAYTVFDSSTGDVTQLAVDKNYRKQGIGSCLLGEMIKLNRYDSVKVVNTDPACSSMTIFLETNGIPLRGKQFEMIKVL